MYDSDVVLEVVQQTNIPAIVKHAITIRGKTPGI